MIFRSRIFSKALNRCRSARVRPILRNMLIPGILVGIYVVFCLGLTAGQRHLIYFPCRESFGVLQARADSEGFEAWRGASGEFIGWKRLATKQAAAGQVLILHGNAGCALDRTPYAETLQSIGSYDIYILEYPGYGRRAGSASQASIFRAATEAMCLLKTTNKTYLIGESLGTGVACYLAGTSTQSVAGVLLIAPYNNLATVAQHHMPIFPARWLLRDKYRSDVYLKNYSGPVAFILAGRDTVIPCRFGRRLYDGYRGPKQVWEVREAGHNEIHEVGISWWKEAIEFWQGQGATVPKTRQ